MPLMPSFPSAMSLTRRHALIGGAGVAAGLLLPSLARAQTRLQVTEGNVAPLPIAIPNFVAGTPSDAEVGNGVAQVITNNLKLTAGAASRRNRRLRRSCPSMASNPQQTRL